MTVWTPRTFHIRVEKDRDGSFYATETGTSIEGVGDTPHEAIRDYADQCETVVRDSMEADA